MTKPTVIIETSVASLPVGLYRLFWHSGESSEAAVGVDSAGEHWYAPTNWINGVPSYDWSGVSRAIRIRPF